MQQKKWQSQGTRKRGKENSEETRNEIQEKKEKWRRQGEGAPWAIESREWLQAPVRARSCFYAPWESGTGSMCHRNQLHLPYELETGSMHQKWAYKSQNFSPTTPPLLLILIERESWAFRALTWAFEFWERSTEPWKFFLLSQFSNKLRFMDIQIRRIWWFWGGWSYLQSKFSKPSQIILGFTQEFRQKLFDPGVECRPNINPESSEAFCS